MFRKKVVSLNISILSYQEALQHIISKGKLHQSGYVCFANVHMTIEAYQHPEFATQVNASDLTTADGVPLKMALNHLYGIRQDRIAGMDAMPDLFKMCEAENLSVAFYGSNEETQAAIKQRIEKEHPNLKIASQIVPPFKALSQSEIDAYIQQINDSGANLVMVCLGCPKQEKWMATYSAQINAMLLGVGGAFATYAGEKKRSPVWMQKLALEWLFRLWQEPGRMFKRYFITNSLFMILMIKEWLSVKLNSKNKP
jgi:N-acetylglucosaminyldiphosphoundecaprenol N-acetyl-beta-D-mannosaminyltransferase